MLRTGWLRGEWRGDVPIQGRIDGLHQKAGEGANDYEYLLIIGLSKD